MSLVKLFISWTFAWLLLLCFVECAWYGWVIYHLNILSHSCLGIKWHFLSPWEWIKSDFTWECPPFGVCWTFLELSWHAIIATSRPTMRQLWFVRKLESGTLQLLITNPSLVKWFFITMTLAIVTMVRWRMYPFVWISDHGVAFWVPKLHCLLLVPRKSQCWLG